MGKLLESDGFEIRGIRQKIAKGVGKTVFARLFRPQRGLTKGYWHGELGTLGRVSYIISKLRPSATGVVDKLINSG